MGILVALQKDPPPPEFLILVIATISQPVKNPAGSSFGCLRTVSHFAALGWTPLLAAARAGARSKHSSRQTKTNPVWHAPRRHFPPCHPSLRCVSPFTALVGRLFPL